MGKGHPGVGVGSPEKFYLEHLENKIKELREVTAEANGVLKDIRVAKKEALAVIEDMRENIHEKIGVAVKDGLDDLGESIRKNIDTAQERIDRRFDKIGNILMGEDSQARREGKGNFEDLVRNWMKNRES